MVIPGVAGICCLIVAAFGMSFVPVNLLSILLVVLGCGLLLAEIYVGSFGLLGVGGIAAIAWGGLFLVKESPEFTVGVDPTAVGTIGILAHTLVTDPYMWSLFRIMSGLCTGVGLGLFYADAINQGIAA